MRPHSGLVFWALDIEHAYAKEVAEREHEANAATARPTYDQCRQIIHTLCPMLLGLIQALQRYIPLRRPKRWRANTLFQCHCRSILE